MPKGKLERLAMLLILTSLAGQAQAAIYGSTTANLKVRAAPGGEQIDSLRAGSVVALIEISGTWAKVLYMAPSSDANSAKTGWVSLNYLYVHTGGVSGDECETDYATGAEVCVSVEDGSIDCDKRYGEEYYRSCDVEIEYEISTDYEGGSTLNVEVECEAEISYMGNNTYSRRSDSDSDSQDHSLWSGGRESDTMGLDFSFSSYLEVTRVQIEDAHCEIYSVNLW